MDTRYDVSELKSACTLINTADYCQTTALELEENIRTKCDEAFKEQITLQDERDLFVRYAYTPPVYCRAILTHGMLVQSPPPSWSCFASWTLRATPRLRRSRARRGRQ